MSDQSDQPSDASVKPWTIKGIPMEARNAAIAAADREKQTIGEWMTRAILSQVQSDRQRSRAPTVVRPEAASQSDLVEVAGQTNLAEVGRLVEVATQPNLSDVERLVELALRVASANGGPPPKAISRLAYRQIRERLQLGAPPSAPAIPLDGPTSET